MTKSPTKAPHRYMQVETKWDALDLVGGSRDPGADAKDTQFEELSKNHAANCGTNMIIAQSQACNSPTSITTGAYSEPDVDFYRVDGPAEVNWASDSAIAGKGWILLVQTTTPPPKQQVKMNKFYKNTEKNRVLYLCQIRS